MTQKTLVQKQTKEVWMRLNQNHIPIPGKKDTNIPDISSENEIPLNTNVINSYNKNYSKLSVEKELEKSFGSMIDTSLEQNENLNNDNISDKEIDGLIENKFKSLNKIKSVDDHLKEISFDLNNAEKKAYKDGINDTGCKSPVTNEKLSGYTERASNDVNMIENDHSLTSTNINEDEDKNYLNNDNQERDRSEISAADDAVEITCEVDCNKLLDDVKTEINGDQDYTVPENFMDLANHFLTQEARVILKRIVVYKCPECPRVFTTAGQRSMHKAKHVSEQVISKRRNKESSEERFFKGLQCPKCDMRFVQESTLTAHMIIHQPFPNICHCGVGYYKLTDLEQHAMSNDQTKQETETKSVHKSTWKPIIHLKKTKRSEINRKRCKKEPDVEEPTPEPTTSRYGRKQQRIVTLRERSPILEYDSDDLNDETLYEPKEKKHKVNFKTVQQVQAAAAKKIASALKKSQAKLIKKEKVINKGPFICSICNKELKCYRNYEVHLESHGNLRNYKCDICDKAFNTATGLRNHKVRHLDNQYKCSFCDKTFNCKFNMKTHERIHMNIRPYICGYCEKAFSDPSAKQRHERIHTGVKPYKCQHCPKAFSDASAAIVHRQRHENVRSFACRHCDMCYHTKGSRDLHEKLHVNGYDFECDICQASFQLKRYLVNHMNNKHLDNANKVECSICGHKLKKHYMASHKLAVHGVKAKSKKVTVFTKPVKIEIEIKKEV